MQMSVTLDQNDIKRAIEQYVTANNPAGMEGYDVTINYHAGSNDPRETSYIITATAKLRNLAQPKDYKHLKLPYKYSC